MKLTALHRAAKEMKKELIDNKVSINLELRIATYGKTSIGFNHYTPKEKCKTVLRRLVQLNKIANRAHFEVEKRQKNKPLF